MIQLVDCYLTDQNGERIDPRKTGSIQFKKRYSMEVGGKRCLIVTIRGYVSCFLKKELIVAPVPFSFRQKVILPVREPGTIYFQVKEFCCSALFFLEETKTPKFYIKIGMVTLVLFGEKQKEFYLLESKMRSTYRLRMLKAKVEQYYTIGDGMKRTFTNEDTIASYGEQVILNPKHVSYYNVFVNGMLLPKVDYKIEEGRITFVTNDVPGRLQPIVIVFISYYDRLHRVMTAKNESYNARSDGNRRVYTDHEELMEYGTNGIPNPNEVSLVQLYINGVLQPPSNYKIERNHLELLTGDLPPKEAVLTLESIMLYGPSKQLIPLNETQYNTYYNGGLIYCNNLRIQMYDSNKIVYSRCASYQTLYVNGVLQPRSTYRVGQNCLCLVITNGSVKGAPITLQSVRAAIFE